MFCIIVLYCLSLCVFHHTRYQNFFPEVFPTSLPSIWMLAMTRLMYVCQGTSGTGQNTHPRAGGKHPFSHLTKIVVLLLLGQNESIHNNYKGYSYPILFLISFIVWNTFSSRLPPPEYGSSFFLRLDTSNGVQHPKTFDKS